MIQLSPMYRRSSGRLFLEVQDGLRNIRCIWHLPVFLTIHIKVSLYPLGNLRSVTGEINKIFPSLCRSEQKFGSDQHSSEVTETSFKSHWA